MTLMEYTEIEFNVTFGEIEDHWTNIFRIGNQDDLRFPGLYMSPFSEYISVHKTTNHNLWYPDSLSNPSIALTSNEMVGPHHLYIAITPTQYTLIWDDIPYRYSGDFGRSDYLGTIQSIYFSDNTFTSTNAIFDNICIRSSSSGLSIDSTSSISWTPSTTSTEVIVTDTNSMAPNGEEVIPPSTYVDQSGRRSSEEKTSTMIAEIALVGFVFLVCAAGTFFLRRKWDRQQRPDGSVKVEQVDSQSQKAVMDSPAVGGIRSAAIERIMSEPGIDIVTQSHRSETPGMIDQRQLREDVHVEQTGGKNP